MGSYCSYNNNCCDKTRFSGLLTNKYAWAAAMEQTLLKPIRYGLSGFQGVIRSDSISQMTDSP